MLKSLCLSVILFFASVLLVAEATLSSPLPQGTQFIAEATLSSPPPLQAQSSEKAKTQSKEAAKAKVDVLESAEKSADSNIVNSSSSSEKAPVVSASRSTYPQPPYPYDTEAIKKFDAELYGAGN
jgi:hypothetical protein